VVVDSGALKEDSPPGTAPDLAAVSQRLSKSAITEQELFVTLAQPRLAPLSQRAFAIG
jgi:hypothetical protein